MPADVCLLIEVADSSLNYDRDRKAAIYAKANIPEYWVIDINQQQLLMFRKPAGETYQVQQVLGLKDAIALLSFPDIVIAWFKLML